MITAEEIVRRTASGPNSSGQDLVDSLEDLMWTNDDINYGMLVGSALGTTAEAGEYAELVKKHVFQGKPLDRNHALRELADQVWYIAQGAMALGSDLEELIKILDDKLKARYKTGGFTVDESNNRVEGDL